MNVSVVISSYNQDDKVLETLATLFLCDVRDFDSIEVILIDDGSPRPLRDLIPRMPPIPPKVELKLLTQQNRGIGATRNRGFREALFDHVIFLDDDILVPPTILQQFVNAHDDRPKAILFGAYPFKSHEYPALKYFVTQLNGYDQTESFPRYEKVEAMISGALSIKRTELSDLDYLYRDDMTVPCAEEYEAIARICRSDISLLRAFHIAAIHNHHLTLDWLLEQQFKYGLGTAEAFSKSPEIVELPKFAVIKEKLSAIGSRGLKNKTKMIMSRRALRAILKRVTQVLLFIFPSQNYNRLLGLLTSTYFWAGYQTGVGLFRGEKMRPDNNS